MLTIDTHKEEGHKTVRHIVDFLTSGHLPPASHSLEYSTTEVEPGKWRSSISVRIDHPSQWEEVAHWNGQEWTGNSRGLAVLATIIESIVEAHEPS